MRCGRPSARCARRWRGATAGRIAAADGPLPVGDLVAAGMAIRTVIDIVRLSDALSIDALSIDALSIRDRER
jgi:hypothetical protein